jgi:phospholipid transport system substrate-binding protein
MHTWGSQTLNLQLRRLAAVLLSVSLFLPIAGATAESPDVLLTGVAKQMTTALNANREQLSQDPVQLNRLVSDILLPHMDFISASKWVLGKHWSDASRAQKKQFILEFRTLLVRFYATALSEYLAKNEVREETIRILPLRAPPDENSVTVRSEVYPPSGQPIPVLYHMHLRRDRWRIYDVSVDGVSMVSTYRTSFDTEIRERGLDGLIASLAERNQELLKKAQTTVN